MKEKFKVIYKFKDLKDNGYIYDPKGKDNSIYPREGLNPSKTRIKELSTEKNKIGKVLIQKIEEETEVDNEEEKNEDKTETEKDEVTESEEKEETEVEE